MVGVVVVLVDVGVVGEGVVVVVDRGVVDGVDTVVRGVGHSASSSSASLPTTNQIISHGTNNQSNYIA